MAARIAVIGIVIVLLYVVLIAASFGHSHPVAYQWTGSGNHATIDFLMPSDPVPLLSSNPWTLMYRVACHGLRSPRGAPPGFSSSDTFDVDVTGHVTGPFRLGIATSVEVGTSRFSDQRRWTFQKGGAWTLRIRARQQCQWVVTAMTKP